VLGRKDGGRARDRGRLERKRALGCRFQGGGVFEELLKTGWKLEYHQQTWFRNYISQYPISMKLGLYNQLPITPATRAVESHDMKQPLTLIHRPNLSARRQRRLGKPAAIHLLINHPTTDRSSPSCLHNHQTAPWKPKTDNPPPLAISEEIKKIMV